MGLNQWCTVEVANAMFGVDVARVLEVVREAEVERIPLAPAGVRGLVNLRGQLVCAIDVRYLLGRDESTKGGASAAVVVSVAGETVALCVDRVGDVAMIGENERRSTPGGVDEMTAQVSPAVALGEEALIAELDVDALVARVGRRR